MAESAPSLAGIIVITQAGQYQILMFRKLKPLILFLVLAAMSLRGMAAVDMWNCAHGKSDAIFVSGSQHGHHHDMHEKGIAVHLDHADHGSSAPAEPADDPAHQMSSHCISGVAAPVERISFSFAPVGASRIPFVELPFAGVVPAQLDRPPLRQIL